jgi:hypothetical protein
MTLARYRNVILLALAQACYLATSMTIITFGGLAGQMLTFDEKFATLPVSLAGVPTALTAAPMALLMQRTSRRFRFRLRSARGVVAGRLGA